jgi:hypothetical protein
MESNERYQAWKRRRAEVELSPRFAERVMGAITERESKQHRALVLPFWLTSVLNSRPAKVGVCVLAGLVCVLRVLHVVAVFIPE